MIPPLRAMDPHVAALRLVTRHGNGDWLVLIVQSNDDVQSAANEFGDLLEMVGSCAVSRIIGASNVEELAVQLSAAQGPVVISGLDAWPASEWAHFDHLRSRFSRHERTALLIHEQTLRHIMQQAPNLSSWLGASVVNYAPESVVLTEEQREQRLSALRSWAGLTDAEVVSRAEAKELPLDPEFAEWLVLLHRGDLIHG